MQLLRGRNPRADEGCQVHAAHQPTAPGLWAVSFVLSVACFLAYRWAGMAAADAFDAHVHDHGAGRLVFARCELSGIGTPPAIEWVATVFMTLAGISFLRYFMVWRSRSLRPVTDDREIRMYIVVLLVSVLVVFVSLLDHQPQVHAADTLRAAMFHVVSVATTTGYSSQDYTQWPVALPVLMMFLGSFASCAGSTGGGIKMVRMVLLIKQARRELVRIIHPRVVNPVTLGGQTVPAPVMHAVLGFMLIYGGATMGLTFLMLLSGLDIVTAFSAVVATVNNIGPGLGRWGRRDTSGA